MRIEVDRNGFMNERFRQDNTEGYSDEDLVCLNSRYASAVRTYAERHGVEEEDIDLSILDALAETILDNGLM